MPEPVSATASTIGNAVESAPADESRSGPRLSPRAIVALLTVLAAVLRLLFLGRLSIWGDEGASVEFATKPFHDMLHVMLTRDPNMALYHLLLRPWMALGDGEATVRMLSVIFSLATIPVFFAMAKRLTDMRTAIVATLLLALNAFEIRYAQEVRAYSMFTLLVCISWLFFLRSRETPTARNLAVYVAASALGAYAQIFAVLSYAAQWTALAVVPHLKTRWRSLIPAGIAVAILSAPILIVSRIADVGQLGWILPLSFAQVQELVYSLAGVVAGGPAAWLMPAVTLMLAAAGFLSMLAAARRSTEAKLNLVFIAAGVALPIGVLFVVSFASPMFIPRYMIVAVPFFIILVAAGLRAIASRTAFAAVLSVLVALSLYHDYRYFRFFDKDDWRGATAYMFESTRPDDGLIVFDGFTRWGYDYYAAKAAADAMRPHLMSPDWDAEFKVDGSSVLDTRARSKREAALFRALDHAPGRYARIWLMLCANENVGSGSDQTTRKLMPAMDQNYRLASERDFYNIRVLLYDRR